MTENNEDPKIIVDDDWKAQVEREKEQLAAADSESPKASDEMPQGEMPPASFEMLVTSLATQAMAALGFFPDPSTGETMLNRPIAKHFIDTLLCWTRKPKAISRIKSRKFSRRRCTSCGWSLLTVVTNLPVVRVLLRTPVPIRQLSCHSVRYLS